MEGELTTAHNTFFEKYFFSRSRYPNAGLIRFILCGSFLILSFRNFKLLKAFGSVSSEIDMLHKPGAFISFLHLPSPIPKELILPFAIIFYTVGVLAMLGMFTRFSVFLFSILLIYITDIQASRGFFNHEFSLTTQVLLVLTFIPGTKNFSVDRLVVWLKQKRKGISKSLLGTITGPPEYVWGIKLILMILACTYFTSGLSKVRYGGWEWLDGKTLTHYLDGSASPYTQGKKPMFISPYSVSPEEKWKDGFGINSYSYGNRQANVFWRETGKSISSHPTLIKVIAISVVIFEMLGFILLTEGWGKVFYLLGAILMHKSIGSLMNLPFLQYQILCFLLIDWNWVYHHLNKKFKTLLQPGLLKLKALLKNIK